MGSVWVVTIAVNALEVAVAVVAVLDRALQRFLALLPRVAQPWRVSGALACRAALACFRNW